MRWRFSLLLLLVGANLSAAEPPVAIGSRLELFVDRALIENLSGGATLKVQQPVPREVALVTGEPWEGNTCAYYTILRDGDTYRMYYRGSHYNVETKQPAHPEVVCYAESKDGVHWVKPKLGLVEFGGSKENNIIWNGTGSHNFAPFLDTNPDCDPEARFKAFGSGNTPGKRRGLYAFKSADGVRWSLLTEEAVITTGAFDSQNLAFYDGTAKVYREYHRGFNNKVRDIMTGTSKDFLNWPEPAYLKYPGAPVQHLYTNAIRVYERAPHFLIGFPTRFLSDEDSRVEPVFMSSRDGSTFHRFHEELISQDAPEDRRGNRSNYMANGLVQLPGNDREYSVYATEAYYTGPDSRLRRFTYRVDGFVALTAGKEGGSATTKPITFTGRELVLNSRPREGGAIRVELQDAEGKAIPGFEANNCRPLSEDQIEGRVEWKSGSVLTLAGKPVRVRFELKDADLFSWKFQ